jgi:hypothetical protein
MIDHTNYTDPYTTVTPDIESRVMPRHPRHRPKRQMVQLRCGLQLARPP